MLRHLPNDLTHGFTTTHAEMYTSSQWNFAYSQCLEGPSSQKSLRRTDPKQYDWKQSF